MGLGRVWMGKVGVVVGLSLALALTGGCSTKKGDGEDGGLTDESLDGSKGSLGEFNQSGRVGEGGRFENVYFAYDSADLDSAGVEATRANAELLRRESGKVEIEGHCDERGTTEYNLALGARRANAIRTALIELGINGKRMSAAGFGEELPVCHEATESCWARNRRGHIVDVVE